MAGGDRGAEGELLALVDEAPVVPPLGLRAHRARYAALIALRDGAALDEAEALLRHSLDLSTQWGARAWLDDLDHALVGSR